MKVSATCALLSPIVAYIGIGLAILQAPWFSWSRNALSDLGASPESAPYFNTALIIAGLLLIVFALYLISRPMALIRAAGVLLCASSIALACIGVFPETVHPHHFIASVAFFIITPFATAALAIAYRCNQKLSASLGLAAILAFLVWFPPWPAIAVPELFSSLCDTIPLAYIALRCLKASEETGALI